MLRCADCGARRDASGKCPRHGTIAHGVTTLETAPPRPSVPGFVVHEQLAVGGQGSIWHAPRVKRSSPNTMGHCASNRKTMKTTLNLSRRPIESPTS